jgi:hypothetical protein
VFVRYLHTPVLRKLDTTPTHLCCHSTGSSLSLPSISAFRSAVVVDWNIYDSFPDQPSLRTAVLVGWTSGVRLCYLHTPSLASSIFHLERIFLLHSTGSSLSSSSILRSGVVVVDWNIYDSSSGSTVATELSQSRLDWCLPPLLAHSQFMRSDTHPERIFCCHSGRQSQLRHPFRLHALSSSIGTSTTPSSGSTVATESLSPSVGLWCSPPLLCTPLRKLGYYLERISSCCYSTHW